MWSCWRRTLFTFVLLCYFSLFVRFFLFLQCTKTDSLAETKKKWGEFFVVVVFFKKKVKYKWNLFPIWIRIQLHDINPIFFLSFRLIHNHFFLLLLSFFSVFSTLFDVIRIYWFPCEFFFCFSFSVNIYCYSLWHYIICHVLYTLLYCVLYIESLYSNLIVIMVFFLYFFLDIFAFELDLMIDK